MGQNRIYANFDAGLAKQQCNPPGWPSDEAAAQIFYQAAILCLDNAWKPLITAVGMKFRSPKLSITKNCGDTPVGSGGYSALYCTEHDTLYMPVKGMPPEKYGDKAIIYLSTLAHENGHHVQHLIGTSSEWYSRALVVGEQSAKGLELSRRSELQAQCFSGMFVGSVIETGGRFTVADYQIALGDNAKRGDWDSNLPRSHGTSEHSGSWWDHGYRLNKIGECNTWLSPASDVS
ncbi:neutral zinc metallopeptidase [Mycolicibacterium fortuitum]|uniref:neutral zinc metallopeptidase n=1 Tax=Mycolicibacterium fortuitum TaxID=1766 RepID=UPI0009BFBD01|nr:neutral zinc metallopeptidase [Mycolicibacterium fortuitum]